MGTKKEIDVNGRFLELMRRDPIVRLAVLEIQNFYLRNPHAVGVLPEVPSQIAESCRGIMSKWGLALLETTLSGDFTIQKADQPIPLVSEFKPAKAYRGKRLIHNSVFVRTPGHLYLDVNLNALNVSKDKGKVLNAVWGFVERYSKSRRSLTGGSGSTSWFTPHPENDREEVGFVYHIKEDTFQKYLRWYDDHVGDSLRRPKGLPFRTIAFIEYVRHKAPDKADETKEKIVKRGTIGTPIRGEDAIERAVKLIYHAIHGKPYPSKKAIKTYDCPEHGLLCDEHCKYAQRFMKKSSLLYEPRRRRRGRDVDIWDPKSMKPPARAKRARISNERLEADD